MKNREANRNVLKAISIGLSAALSLMPTVTAFADDDVDADSSPSEAAEESSSSESNESHDNDDVKEEVSEASEAIEDAGDAVEAYFADPGAEAAAEAAPEAEAGAETGAEGLNPIAVDITTNLDESAAAVESLGGDVSALDQINYEIEEANADYEAAVEAAETTVTYAENKTQEAKETVEKASKAAEESHEEAEKRQEETSEAAAKIYSDANAAESAKEEASAAADEVQTALDEGQEAVDEAQVKLDEASKALEVAEGAVELAAREKADADAKEAEAKEKLEALLNDCDVEYERTEDGDIVFEDDTKLDSKTRKAIESAQKALDAARSEAEAAAQSLADANNEEYQAAKEKAEASKTLLESAESTLKTSEEAAKPDENMEDWIAKIREQQEVIKNATDKRGGETQKKTPGTVFYESGKLATIIEAYQISLMEGIDKSSISVEFDSSINAKNLWYVKYKNEGSDCYYRTYVDVKCDLNKPGNVKTCEHPVTNPKPLSFGEDEVIGQIESGSIGTTVEAAKNYLSEKYGYDVSDISVPSWGAKGSATADNENYIPVYHEKDGVTERFYFYYGTAEDGSVEVYLKNPTEMGATGAGDIFEKKGSQYDEAGFNNEVSAYEASKAAAEESLAQAKEQYDAALSANKDAEDNLKGFEDRINDLQAQSDRAAELEDKVKNARDQVVEAAEALKQAKAASAVSADKLAELEKKLEDARTEYNDAAAELKSANDKLDEIKVIVDSMREEIDSGFRYQTPSSGGQSRPAAQEGETPSAEEAGSGAEEKKEEAGAGEEEKKEEAGAGEEEKKEEAGTGEEEKQEETGNEEATEKEAGKGDSGNVNPGGGEKKGSAARPGANRSASSEESEAEEDESDTDTVARFVEAMGDSFTPSDNTSDPDMTAFTVLDGAEGSNITAAFTDLSAGAAAVAAGEASTGAVAASETSAGADIIAGVPLDEGVIESGVAGERMAPIVKAVENGTFTRSMMLTEEGTKAAPFPWWLLMLVLGAKGVQMYVKNRKEAEQKVEE